MWGVVTEVGRDVTGFKPGDRVASNGPHADVVRVPKHLCARIPDNVSDEEAAFTVVASIGLQGLRLIQPTLGESIVVTGVGLIGLLTVQLLLAQGCRVLAIDFDDAKLKLARSFGADTCNPGNGEDPVAAGMVFSRGHGVDGVLIAASIASNDPVTQATRMCRKRGRIVLVGVTGLALNRADFYEKELSFLAGSKIVSVQARCMGDGRGVVVTEDKAAILLGFEDGSFGAIHYLANGAASFPKERVEVFAAGRVLQLDNFIKLKGYGWPGFKKMNLWRQDKGQQACAAAFLAAIEHGRPSPIPVEEIFEVARVSIEAAHILRAQQHLQLG